VRGRNHQFGFTYIGLMFAVAVLGITLATVGVVWSTQIRREKEAELLWIGDQYRDAIGRYRAAGGVYPQQLSDLVEDNRFPLVRRYLRKLFPDPMTGQLDWQLIPAPGSGFMGVASTSTLKPIKVAGFPVYEASFESADCYCAWAFVNQPRIGRHHRSIRPTGST
jgi:type II secretory pathway pseudopilin PulG